MKPGRKVKTTQQLGKIYVWMNEAWVLPQRNAQFTDVHDSNKQKEGSPYFRDKLTVIIGDKKIRAF